jgi:Tol biopolymer transport system component
MNRYRSLPWLRSHTLLAARTEDPAGPTRRPLALAAAFAVFVCAGATFAGAAQASFPGTNGLIACSGPLGPNPPPAGGSFLEIFTMNASGEMTSGVPESQVRLQNNTASDFNPRFSADGTQIAFVKDNNIWKMNANGTNEVQLTGLPPTTTPNIDSFVGGWSPDGSKIVFQRSNPAAGAVPANFEVFTINADGTGLTNVSNNPGSATVGSSDSQPSFSPDGTKIAFQSNRRGNPDIWVMNANGTGARPLTADSYAEESAPEFSPDGQQIAFQSDRGFFPRPGIGRNLEIYRMNAADGSNVTKLTTSDYNPAATGGETTANLSGFDLNPHWSPAGDRIVFHSGRGIEFAAAQWDAFHINAITGETMLDPAVRLTARDLNDERCGWSVATPHVLLSVEKAGSGVGTVTSSPGGIDCGPDCAQGYADDTEVTLTAVASAGGSTFTGFTGGGCSGPGLTCTVTVDAAKTVTATFTDANPELTVTKDGSGARKAGTGFGTVTSAPAGIDCGGDCSEEYTAGQQVTLTAAPDAGSTFDGFTGGGCSGTGNTCVVTVDAAKTVTAIFSGPLLTVTKAGTGAASTGANVTSVPLGVFCGVDCSEDYATSTSVVLTATGLANNVAGGLGVAFTSFSGCDSTTATTCTVAMSAAKNVTATFTDFPTLTVTKTGTGTGTVASGAGGLNCGATCTRDFSPTTPVTLTATPAAGSNFAGFAGCATTPTPTTCTVTVDAAKTVTASFLLIPRLLTVTKAGDGAGTVTSAPSGISCGADCEQDFGNGTGITLTAAPADGSSFAGFTGAGCSGNETTCAITMDEAKSVTATFTANPAPPPPPPPPPPAVTPPPPPPPAAPGATPARRSGSLSASVTPSRDLRAPYSFRTTGRLTRPSGITQAAGCSGRVSIQVKRGNTTISTRRVTLSRTCTFSSRVSFSSRSRFRSATRLKFTARFLGNALILPDSAPSRFARVRR